MKLQIELDELVNIENILIKEVKFRRIENEHI